MLPRRLSRLTVSVAITSVYFLAGKLGLKLAFLHASASPVWPPAGIALGALVVVGYRMWPAIFVGAFLVNVTTAGNFGTSLAIAAGNTLEALSGAWLVRQFAGGTRVFERSQDVFKFAFAAVVSTMLSPSVGVTSLALAGFADWARYGAVWTTWWLGDAAGELIVAPLVILWAVTPRWRWSGKRDLEVAALLLLLMAIGQAVFGGWFKITATNYPIAFVCAPVVIWMAFRMSQRETATGVFILSGIAIWGTLRKFGPFVMETENQSLLILQTSTAVLTVTALALAAAMAERRRAQAALEAQKSLVETANQTKDKFLGMLSHELRTPLTPVLLAVETLRRQWPQSAEAETALEIIRRNVGVEKRLIDDLLDVTRISKGKLELHLSVVDVHRQILNVIETCRAESEAKRIRVQLELKATDHHIAADEARFQQIIWNLLKNAIKFSPEQSDIIISSSNDVPGQLAITVHDHGIGMEPETMKRIFDPFEQGERSFKRRFGGLGLGLAISKLLADAHDALLLAKSDGLNQGATFSVIVKTTPPVSQAKDGERIRDEPSTPALRILLVDDHVDTCAIMGMLLRGRGHAVTIAHDLRSALEKLQAAQFDLLISDVGLPDGSGMELMTIVRATSAAAGIAMSGFGTDLDFTRSVEAGFSEHLVKPVTVERLDAAVRAAVNGRDRS